MVKLGKNQANWENKYVGIFQLCGVTSRYVSYVDLLPAMYDIQTFIEKAGKKDSRNKAAGEKD